MPSLKSSVFRVGLEKGRRGFSLILVVLILTLLTVLVLSFFAGVTSDLTTTTAYVNGTSTRKLTDNVVQLLEGQIKDATTAPVDNGGIAHSYTNNKPFTWASQPGMIRTYDDKGNGLMFYKLYSSSTMRTVWNDAGGYQNSLDADLSLADVSDPAEFTDLNRPVNNVYPIADPNYLTDTQSANSVQGFTINGTAPANVGGATDNKLPMPVRWLYKLQDGTLVAAPSGGGGTVKIDGAGPDNPIVGRVAFWADDETSKVNINTAGEGTYWDTPRFWGTSQQTITPNPGLNKNLDPYPDPEYAYAMSQPAQYEFQRYPGHPAQVAITPIFPQIAAKYPTPSLLSQSMVNFTPFLASGGSEAGTISIDNLPNGPPGLNALGALDLKNTQRKSIYSSVDEFLYSTAAASPRTATDSSITTGAVQAAKFFATANSRAPELNLFGKPRIACWPISNQFDLGNANSAASQHYTTVFDRLIALCSSLKVKTAGSSYAPYYFQRSQPNSSTSFDYSGIQRNQDLYKYLQALTGQSIPGFGGNFFTKYGNDRDQILTEIFDYIRCTDLCDPALFSPSGAPSGSGAKYCFAVSTPSRNDAANITYPVTPIKIGTTMGFGRTSIVDQVGICLICVIDGNNIDYGPNDTIRPGSNPAASSTNPYTSTGYVAAIPDYTAILQGLGISDPNFRVPKTQRILQAAFVMGGYDPCFGAVQNTLNSYMSVTGLSSLQIANTNPFGSNTSNAFCVRCFKQGTYYGTVDGPFISPQHYANGANTTPPQYMDPAAYPYAPASPSNFYYPCISKPFLVTAAANSNITVSGASLQIQMIAANVNAGRLNDPAPPPSAATPVYQTITFQYPTMDMKVPDLNTIDKSSAPWGFKGRIQGAATFSELQGGLVTAGSLWGQSDSVKSIFLVDHGDSRLLAASANPKTHTILPSYPYATKQWSHYFRYQQFYMQSGTLDVSTALVKGLSYPYDTKISHVPLMPWTGSPPVTVGNLTANRDFDNVLGYWPDGPGINKPDEGDSGGIPASGGKIGNHVPYLDMNYSDTATRGATFFTPNRIMPSAGMFGSLPTGIIADNPWQTLLFRPQVGHTQAEAHNDTGYNSYGNPPDHLFLDLFWMPIVEPYAISDSFSTAGKINMNYQIQPFNYIDRNTSLVCLLKNEKIIAVPDTASRAYKAVPATEPAKNSIVFRFGINSDEKGGSLRQFRTRFDAGDIFRSASEICDIYLVPNNADGSKAKLVDNSAAEGYWSTHRLTGDNSRERPYTNLYGRLTTKSNTFTVHMKVQTLKQSLADRQTGTWVEPKSGNTGDTITGEYQGSTLLERYLDPSDTTLPDYATTTGSSPSLDSFYKFRVVSSTQFTP